MPERDEDRAADEAVSPGSAQESGPLGGGRPVEPTPARETAHPTPEAERRSEEIRRGGEAEAREDA